jgi:hypothetical protein
MVKDSLDAINVVFDDDRLVADAGCWSRRRLRGDSGSRRWSTSVWTWAAASGTSGRDAR